MLGLFYLRKRVVSRIQKPQQGMAREIQRFGADCENIGHLSREGEGIGQEVASKGILRQNLPRGFLLPWPQPPSLPLLEVASQPPCN